MQAIVQDSAKRSETQVNPVVVALCGKKFSIHDRIDSKLVRPFVKISRDKNPIHINKDDCKQFGIPCTFKPMHGMLMASRIGGLIWEIIEREVPEPVRPVIVDGVPRFKKFMRLDVPFTLNLTFSYVGAKKNGLLFRLTLEILQDKEVRLKGETRTFVYRKIKRKSLGSKKATP